MEENRDANWGKLGYSPCMFEIIGMAFYTFFGVIKKANEPVMPKLGNILEEKF